MKKFFKNAIALSKLVLMSCCFLWMSCDNDDEHFDVVPATTTNSSFVGTWKYFHNDHNWTTLEFKEDMTGKRINYNYYNGTTHTSKFVYIYNDGNLYLQSKGTDVYKVLSLSYGLMTLEDDEGVRVVYMRMDEAVCSDCNEYLDPDILVCPNCKK